jgi:hypothetical protein
MADQSPVTRWRGCPPLFAKGADQAAVHLEVKVMLFLPLARHSVVESEKGGLKANPPLEPPQAAPHQGIPAAGR